MLFLWNLFEGVPKFYRDCYEQGVLAGSRQRLLEQMFFNSSSPLRTEADNWFLRELRGRYDPVLKFIASHPGCINADIVAHMRAVEADSVKQVGGYLKILDERYRMVERLQPVFAKASARSGRFYIRDNFLRSWLTALQVPVASTSFRPLGPLVAQADVRLADAEGHGLERLVGSGSAPASARRTSWSATSIVSTGTSRATSTSSRASRTGRCRGSRSRRRWTMSTAGGSRAGDTCPRISATSPRVSADERRRAGAPGIVLRMPDGQEVPGTC